MPDLFRLVVGFQNPPGEKPHRQLVRESSRPLEGEHPSQGANGKLAQQIERNPANEPFCVCRDAVFLNVSMAFVKPPRQEVLLLKSPLRHWVINEGGTAIP